MKKIIGAGFILLYISLLLKPFMPYIGYQINKAYIARVLCVNRDKPQLHCDGKCYLDKQLKKANDLPDRDEQIPAPRIDLDKLPTALINYQVFNLSNTQTKKIYFSKYHFSLSEFRMEIPTPPPKALLLFGWV